MRFFVSEWSIFPFVLSPPCGRVREAVRGKTAGGRTPAAAQKQWRTGGQAPLRPPRTPVRAGR